MLGAGVFDTKGMCRDEEEIRGIASSKDAAKREEEVIRGCISGMQGTQGSAQGQPCKMTVLTLRLFAQASRI